MSPQRLTQKVDLWKKHLPSVYPFYAVKCNPDPQILHHLYDAGIGFDCASKRELISVHEMGRQTQPANRIVYANPCKSEHDIQAAKNMGSPITVVDSVEEVEKLRNYTGGALVRIAVDDTTSTMPFSAKFGATREGVSAIGKAAMTNGLLLRGISFHVGSGCYDNKAHGKAIEAAYSAILNLAQQGHTQANIIDIGGGYLDEDTDFSQKAEHIRDAMTHVSAQQHIQYGDDNPIHWIAEPGRFFATNACDFFVQVIGKKRGANGWNYTIDDSLYGQFSSILFDHASPLWTRIHTDGAPRPSSPGILFGRTCDSVDVIAKSDHMEELVVGDWLWFSNMGAYTRATASEFNGFPRPEVFIDDDIAALNIRSAHTPKGVKYMPPVTSRRFLET